MIADSTKQPTMIKVACFAAVLLLSVALVARYMHLSRRPAPVSECKPTDADFIPLTDHRLQRFQAALRFPTVSFDRGNLNSDDLFKFGEYIIRSFPLLHGGSPLVSWERVNNLSLLYHVKGSEPTLLPYLLMAHLDVVPATNLDKWDAPPFEGKVQDDFIYGRGAIDDKQNVFGILEATEFLLSKGIKPKRSFYIALGHDEEVRGLDGAAYLAQRMSKKGVTKLEFILDEGLPVTEGIVNGVSAPVATVGVSEKGYVDVKLSVEMPPGHSSIPPKESSIGVLARAVQRLENNPHPSMLGYGVETDMFERLVPAMSFPHGLVVSNIWLFKYPISWVLSKRPTTEAMIRTMTAVTIFNAGVKKNVVPPLAEAIVNHRIHPSQRVKDVVEYDRALINDPRVKIEVPEFMEPHPVAGYGDEDFGYQVVQTSIRQLWPDAVVVPGIMVGNTDTIHYLNFTTNVYRFSPTHMFPGDPERFHGINERISVRNYEQVINYYFHLLLNSDQAGVTPTHAKHADL